MKLSSCSALGCSLATLLLGRVAAAAPVVSKPLDVAPHLSVESTHTTERVRSVAAGAGKIVVAWGSFTGEKGLPGARFFADDLATADEPIEAPFAQSAVAFDGENFVFAGLRSVGVQGHGAGFQRFRPDGTKLDPAPLFSADGELSSPSSPAVACRAVGECAVVFSAKSSTVGGDGSLDIFFVSFENGASGAPVRLTTAKLDQSLPQIVWDGANWVVAWNDQRFATGGTFNGTGIQYYGARVSAAGQLLDPIGKALTTYEEILDAPSDPSFTSVKPTAIGLLRHGGATWLAWYGWKTQQIVARRFDTALASQDATPQVLLAGKQGFPWSIAAQDSELAVFTTIKGNGAPQEIQMVRLPDGGGASSTTSTGVGIDSVAVAVPSGGYAVGKSLYGTPVAGLNATFDTWVSRVSAAGVVTQSAYASAVPTVVEGRAFASGPAFGIVAYSDNRGGTNSPDSPRKVYVAAVNGAESVTPPEGTLLTDDSVSAGPFPLFDAAISADVALVVWNEGAQGAQDVVGAFIDASGGIVKKVTFGGEPYNETSAHVAFDGTNFVVGWLDSGNGFDVPVTRRIAPDGTFVDPAFTLLNPALTDSITLDGIACDLAGACVATLQTAYVPFTATQVSAPRSSDTIGLFANVNRPSITGGASGFAFLLASQQSSTSGLAQRVSADLVATDKGPLTVLGTTPSSLGTRGDAGWNGQRFVFARISENTLHLGSLAPDGPASAPLVLSDTIRPQPVPWSDTAQGLRAPVQIGGANGRTILGYPDNGRYWVLGIDDVGGVGGSGGSGGTGGTGGTGGVGGSTAGTSGAGGTGGSGGMAGTSGAGGSGGMAGTSGAGGSTAGTSGAGGAGGIGGSSQPGAGAGGAGSSGEGGTSSGSGGEGGSASAGQGGTSSGTGASAGSDASGGGAGKGGSSAGSSGASANGGDPANAADTGADGGCGCRVAPRESARRRGPWGLLGVLGLSVLFGRRRGRVGAARRSRLQNQKG
jgi:hypothetical protein